MKAPAAQTMSCGRCGGSGTTRAEVWNPNTRKYQRLTETCLACMGSGRVSR